MNTCIFMGTITKNGVKTSTYGDNKAKASFSISIYDGKDTKGNSKVTYIPCVAFGKSAEMIAKYFTAGSAISVNAKYSSYEMTGNNGEKKYGHNFTVENVNFLPKDFSQSNGNGGNNQSANYNNNTNSNGNNPNPFGGQANNGGGNNPFSSYQVGAGDMPFAK